MSDTLNFGQPLPYTPVMMFIRQNPASVQFVHKGKNLSWEEALLIGQSDGVLISPLCGHLALEILRPHFTVLNLFAPTPDVNFNDINPQREDQ